MFKDGFLERKLSALQHRDRHTALGAHSLCPFEPVFGSTQLGFGEADFAVERGEILRVRAFAVVDQRQLGDFVLEPGFLIVGLGAEGDDLLGTPAGPGVLAERDYAGIGLARMLETCAPLVIRLRRDDSRFGLLSE